MSIGFGFSVGDLLSAIEVIIDVVQALKDSTGAAAEYKELRAVLDGLQFALQSVKDCKLDQASNEYEAAIEAAESSRTCIENFKTKIAKYDALLSNATFKDQIAAGHFPLKEQVLKIKWAKCHKEDVDKFRAKLATRISAINLLLNAIQLSRMTVSDTKTSASFDEQKRLISEVHERLERSNTDQLQLLQKIELLLSSSPDAVQKINFEVRPLRLIGAPIAPDHIERTAMMSSIEQALLPIPVESQKIVVLQGMGGIGKSQLARNFATKHQRDYTAVFWLNAKTEQSLRRGIAQLAEQIPLPHLLNAGRQIQLDDAGIDAATLAVTDWLCLNGNVGWLLVFDNVDSQLSTGPDDETQPGKSASTGAGFDAYKYIPEVSHGSILITSRLSFLSRSFGATAIRVDEMSTDEGVRLLCKVSHRNQDETGISSLVQRLGAHPLALSQAGKLIYEMRMSPSKYVQKYDARFRTLLKARPDMREYHNGSIATTLGLSYDRLILRNPAAAALLILCSCLDNSSISYELFEAFATAKTTLLFLPEDYPTDLKCPWIPQLPPTWLSDLCKDEDNYFSAIASLHELSFVRYNDRSDSVSIHPLIHEWSLHYCDDSSVPCNLAAACNLLAAMIPQSDPEVLGLPHTKVQPHVERWFSLLPEDLILHDSSTNAMLAIAVYYVVQGPVERASLLQNAAYLNAKSKFGTEHRCALEARMTIATAQFDLGDYKEALEGFEEIHKGYCTIDWEPSLGRKENEALANMVVITHFAICYQRMERIDEARKTIKILEQDTEKLADTAVYPLVSWLYFVLRTAISAGGEDDQNTIKFEQSIEAGERLLKMIEATDVWPLSFGSRQWTKANMLSVLGSQYTNRGDKAKGEDFLQRALEVYESIEGPSSPDTLAVAREIARSGAIPSAPLIMRNTLWRTAITSALTRMPIKTDSEDPTITASALPNSDKKAHAALSHILWMEALTTVRKSVKDRPKR
ncbi:hypothetical protein MMC13_004779 [Lambiella insularis]|nr:hypothetical protein [Lambiella insularis]